MFHRGWFLISVCDSRLKEQVVRIVSGYGVASCEPLSERHVEQLVGSRRWAGCITDSQPRNLAHVAALRLRAPTLPLLVALAPNETAPINALQAKDVEVVVLPVPEPNLVGFVQRALANGFLPDDRVSRLLSHLATERGLTAREVQLLTFSLGNEPRDRVRRRLGIGENTLKTQIRGLLRKCGERSVDGLAKNLLRVALLSEKPPTADSQAVAPWLVTAASA